MYQQSWNKVGKKLQVDIINLMCITTYSGFPAKPFSIDGAG